MQPACCDGRGSLKSAQKPWLLMLQLPAGHGVVSANFGSAGCALLGDAREELRHAAPLMAGLLITSPPYKGVTDYWNDHWIRLWLLGHDRCWPIRVQNRFW